MRHSRGLQALAWDNRKNPNEFLYYIFTVLKRPNVYGKMSLFYSMIGVLGEKRTPAKLE